MTEITTVAALDALPINTLVTDGEDYLWAKTNHGGWRVTSEPGIPSSRLLHLWAPLKLSLVPKSHMTKCVADDCLSSHALPPGSSWACSEHAKHLTLGGN